MRIGHVADLHLGFRQYDRATKSGMNQREVDVAMAFRRVVDDMIAQRVEAVLIAGDLFHSVRPTNQAILEAERQLSRLARGLNGAPIFIIAGNHDSPRSVETGSIMPLFEGMQGVMVAWQSIRQVRDYNDELVVTMVPHLALLEGQAFAPDLTAKCNVLLIHGATPGLRDDSDVSADVRDAVGWDYVALGDYHVCRQVGPRAWYPGSTEWVSSDPWSEQRENPDKGWLMVDLKPGELPVVEFRPVGCRNHVDLPALEAATAEQVNDRLHNLDVLDLEGSVVRLVVKGLPRSERAAIDYARVREIRASALHFTLDVRSAETAMVTGAAARGEALSLDAVVDRALESTFAPLGPEESAALRTLATEYLQRPEAVEA